MSGKKNLNPQAEPTPVPQAAEYGGPDPGVTNGGTPAVATSGGAVAQGEPIHLTVTRGGGDDELRIIGKMTRLLGELPNAKSKLRVIGYLDQRYSEQLHREADEERMLRIRGEMDLENLCATRPTPGRPMASGN